MICAHCSRDIQCVPFVKRAEWPRAPRYIHADGRMWCGPAPSTLATPLKRTRVA